MTLRVAVVDDQPLVRAGLAALLALEPDLDVVGEAADGAAGIELCRHLRPDVALVDVRMPVLDGVAATRAITAELPTRVLVITTFDLDEHVYEALRAGAAGFVLKDVDRAELARAVRVVASGEVVLAPSATRRLVQELVARPGRDRPLQPALGRLTAREVDVLRLMARGASNEEIAAALFLGAATVRTHVSAVLAKLGVRNRVQAVVAAYESGFVVPE